MSKKPQQSQKVWASSLVASKSSKSPIRKPTYASAQLNNNNHNNKHLGESVSKSSFSILGKRNQLSPSNDENDVKSDISNQTANAPKIKKRKTGLFNSPFNENNNDSNSKEVEMERYNEDNATTNKIHERRILSAIHSLKNPMLSQIDKWCKSNISSTDNLTQDSARTTLVNLVHAGIVIKLGGRYSLNNSISYQPEPDNSHIHSKHFSINYGELQISKIRSRKAIIDALTRADGFSSLITRVSILGELKEAVIVEILKCLAILEMRKYLKIIEITTNRVIDYNKAFATLDPQNYTNFDDSDYIFPKLQSIVIIPCDFATKNVMNSIVGYASPNLRSLFVSMCESWDDERSWTDVVTKVIEKSNLKNLHFNYGYFHHCALDKLDFVNLERLHLPNCDILNLTPEFLEKFAQCEKLKLLNVNTGLTDVEEERCKQCGEVIKRLRKKHQNAKIQIGRVGNRSVY